MIKRRKYKYHIVYCTTNLINGKKYIGRHSTDNIYDGYIGNGIYNYSDSRNRSQVFARAVSKYGYENFKREILVLTTSLNLSIFIEDVLITERVINDKNYYNIGRGGLGGSYPLKEDYVIERFKKIHGNLYDYSDIEYITGNINIKIKCNRCNNYFYQTPQNHLRAGCYSCNMKSRHHNNIGDMWKKDYDKLYNLSSKPLRKPTWVFNNEGIFIHAYNSVSEIKKTLNIALASSRLRDRKMIHGRYFVYREDLSDTEISTRKLEWYTPKKDTRIVQLDNNNNVIKVFACVRDAAEHFNNNNCSNIRGALKGRQITANGYRWEYFTDYYDFK